jgi:hypothetical protein
MELFGQPPPSKDNKEPVGRTAFNIFAAVIGVFGFGLDMEGTHPYIGILLMTCALVYGAWELLTSKAAINRFPLAVRIIFLVALLAVLLVVSWPHRTEITSDQIENTDKHDNSKKASPDLPPRGSEKPDLEIVIVDPSEPKMVFWPIHATARDVKADPLLWDIDRDDKGLDSLHVNEAKFDWIRTDQHGGPSALIHPDDRNNVVKPGHRIYGYVTVTCPDCKKVSMCWVYFVYGQSGWYAQVPDGRIPDPQKIAIELIPAIRQYGADNLTTAIPKSSMIPIQKMP